MGRAACVKNNPTAALTLPTPRQSLKRNRTGVKQSLLQYTRPLHCTPTPLQSLTWILLVADEDCAYKEAAQVGHAQVSLWSGILMRLSSGQ